MEHPPVATTQAEKAARIDAMMEQASKALVARDYFAAEKFASGALRRAHQEQDFERMARIALPLQEARRFKRDMAIDTGKVTVVDGEIPMGRTLTAGCYLVIPPRVGVDGRMIRDAADEKKVPVVVVVREPPTREGLWPIVTVGPVTVRTKMTPPKPGPAKKAKVGSKSKAKPEEGDATAPITPEPEWFVHACEQLGDEAIGQIAATLPAATRVAALLDRLEAHPNHEKLHQRLAEACREALLEPVRKRKPGIGDFMDDAF